MKYAWIKRHKKHWPVSLACDVLGVSTSGFFENMRRKGTEQPSKPGANKRISNEALLAHIRAIHVEVKQEYGWPKMWKELVARDIRVGKERVRRMMQEHGIKARGKRKFVVTTDSKHKLPIAANLLQRNFTAAAPNQVWTGDITYIATDEALAPDVVDWEPASALFAGNDGLDDYRVIAPVLTPQLAPGGIACIEIGHTQRDTVTALFEAQGFTVDCRPDLAGRDRCLIVQFK